MNNKINTNDSFVIKNKNNGDKYLSNYNTATYGTQYAKRFNSKEEAIEKMNGLQSNWEDMWEIVQIKDSKTNDDFKSDVKDILKKKLSGVNTSYSMSDLTNAVLKMHSKNQSMSLDNCIDRVVANVKNGKKLMDSKCKDSKVKDDKAKETYDLCRKYQFYTQGTMNEYNHLLNNANNMGLDDIARDILNHSNTDTLKKLNIYSVRNMMDFISKNTSIKDSLKTYKVNNKIIKAKDEFDAIRKYKKMKDSKCKDALYNNKEVIKNFEKLAMKGEQIRAELKKKGIINQISRKLLPDEQKIVDEWNKYVAIINNELKNNGHKDIWLERITEAPSLISLKNLKYHLGIKDSKYKDEYVYRYVRTSKIPNSANFEGHCAKLGVKVEKGNYVTTLYGDKDRVERVIFDFKLKDSIKDALTENDLKVGTILSRGNNKITITKFSNYNGAKVVHYTREDGKTHSEEILRLLNLLNKGGFSKVSDSKKNH